MSQIKPERYRTAGFITILLVMVGILTISTATPIAAAQENNTTSPTPTETPTSTKTPCSPGQGEPQMDQARLHASDTTIGTGSPGKISGGFQVSPTANCPVVVHITMSVPSGMAISGGSDFTSGGAGMVTTQFRVRPGANIKDIAANVYSSETGQRTVTANIEYWPEGHKDKAREIDGLSFTFDVEESTTPTESGESNSEKNQTASFPFSNPLVVIIGLLIIVALAIVGLAAR